MVWEAGPPTGGGGGGGGSGAFSPGPQPKRAPPNTCLKDRYTLIEQSQYSSEEQCSKLMDKEIQLVRGSYCHCQQVITFFFWSSTYSLGEVVIQNQELFLESFH